MKLFVQLIGCYESWELAALASFKNCFSFQDLWACNGHIYSVKGLYQKVRVQNVGYTQNYEFRNEIDYSNPGLWK